MEKRDQENPLTLRGRLHLDNEGDKPSRAVSEHSEILLKCRSNSDLLDEKMCGSSHKLHISRTNTTTSFFTKKFVERWFSTFIWLEKGCDEEGRTVMFCRWCRAINANNTFTAGCRDLQKSALTRHELIKDHKRASSVKGAQTANVLKFRESKPSIESTKVLTGLIRNVYFLDMEGIPVSKLEPLTKLQIMNGAKRFEGFRKTHRFSATAMQESVSKAVRQSNSVLFANTSAFGLILIEETNERFESKLGISLRGIKHGRAFTARVDDLQLTNSCANELFDRLCSLLEANCIDMRRIIGVASDGKDVVLNPSDGIVSKMKEHWSPFLIQSHSIFEVTPVNINDGGILYSLQQTIKDLFHFFTNSRIKNVHFHTEFAPKELIAISSISTLTCELFIKAVSFLHSRWNVLVKTLREQLHHQNNFLINHLLNTLLSFHFLASMHTVLDILPLVHRINIAFRAGDFTLTMTRPRVIALKERLIDLISKNGPNETKFGDDFRVANQFHDETIQQVSKSDREAYEKARHVFIQSLVADISLRFPSTDLDAIWALSCIFDVARYPSNVRELERYGNEALTVVINRFGRSFKDIDAIVDPSELRQSFGEFKHILASDTCSNFAEACTVTIMNLATGFPNFARLASIAVVLPIYGIPTGIIEGHMENKEEVGVLIPNRPNLIDAEALIHAACEDYLWHGSAEVRDMMEI